MPGGDRTGPMGMGPMTGRGAGYCAGSPAPGFMNRGFGGGGGGFGRGRGGGGQGWRNWFRGASQQPAAPPVAQTQGLDALAGALEEIKNRIDQLEKQSQAQG